MQKWEYFEQLGSLRARVPAYSFFLSLKTPQSTFYTEDVKWLSKWVSEWLCYYCFFLSLPCAFRLEYLSFFFFFFFNPDLLTFASWHFPFHFSLSFIVQLLLSVSVSLLPSFLCQFLFFYSCDFSLF